MERLTFAVSNSKVEGRTLSGVAHVYGSVTTDGRKHSFAPGAFARSISAGKVVSHAFHDLSKPLASQASGALRLSDSAEGLQFALDLPEGVSYAEDLRALVASGVDLSMSFQYLPSKQSRAKGVTTFTDGRLVSVDPVAMPAFEGTSVILNSAQEPEPAYSTTIKIRARRLSEDVLGLRSANASKQVSHIRRPR